MAVAHSFLVVSVRSVLARPTLTFFLVVFLVLAPTSVVAKSGGIGEIFGSLIGRAVGDAAGKVIVDPKTTEITLQKMTDQLNAKMPMRVDQDTRLDNLHAGPGVRFTYNYTILTATIKDIDRTYFVNHLETKLKAGVCSSPDMQVFFKNNVTVGYSYRASDGVFVAKIEITPKDCGYVP